MYKLFCEIKKNKLLYEDLLKVQKKVLHITSKLNSFCITDHGFSHSERIVDYLCELYENYFVDFICLNEYEVFVLLVSAYLHDIGFYLENSELIEIFCNWHNIEFSYEQEDFYRNMHHEVSAYWVFGNLTNCEKFPQIYWGNTDLGYYIMRVIISHGINFWENPLYYEEIIFKNKEINIMYLSFLLCLADAMDCDKRRNRTIEDLSKYKLADKIYIRSHDYVDRIDIRKNEIIFNVRKPIVSSEKKQIFDEFYVKRTFKWVNLLLEKAKMIFDDLNFSLKFIINISEDKKIKEPTEDEYSFISKKLKL